MIVVLILLCERKVRMSVLMGKVMCLQFGMQEKVVFEHTNAKCHLCII